MPQRPHLAGHSLDNVEGLGLGPPTAHGWSLVGITDNQGKSTRGLLGTRLIVFELRDK